MSLDYSIATIMGRLANWSGFPKYQLERRIDIFITPFLERYFSRKLGGDALLVAPEFPLPRRLAEEVPVGKEDADALTVNVDYLLHVARAAGAPSAWVFLELKTDAGSFKPRQDRAYRRARDEVGMVSLRAELTDVRDASKKHHAKYDRLIRHLERLGFDDDRIEVAYLAPEPSGGFPDRESEENFTRYFSLADFAAQPTGRVVHEHRELWAYVRDILRTLDPGPRGRRSTRVL
jgi:hypothetical protein